MELRENQQGHERLLREKHLNSVSNRWCTVHCTGSVRGSKLYVQTMQILNGPNAIIIINNILLSSGERRQRKDTKYHSYLIEYSDA